MQYRVLPGGQPLTGGTFPSFGPVVSAGNRARSLVRTSRAQEAMAEEATTEVARSWRGQPAQRLLEETSQCVFQCELARCGDGLSWSGMEECDAGAENSDDASCTSTCRVAVWLSSCLLDTDAKPRGCRCHLPRRGRGGRRGSCGGVRRRRRWRWLRRHARDRRRSAGRQRNGARPLKPVLRLGRSVGLDARLRGGSEGDGAGTVRRGVSHTWGTACG